MRFENVSLGEVADVTKLAGFEFTRYITYNDTGEIIALRALNLRHGELDLTDIKRIDKAVSDLLPRSKLYVGDVLLTYTGNGYGDCALITENNRFHLAPNICKITPNPDRIDSYYLYSCIRSSFFYNQMSNYMVGSSQPTIPMKTIRLLEIPLPSLTIQKKIKSIIFNLDEKIRNNQKKNDNLQQQAETIFRSWFVDFEPYNGVMPSEWQISTLGEATEMGAGGDKPKAFSAVKSSECPYPIYSNGLSDEGLYGYTDIPKIKDESVTVSARGTIGFVCLRHIPYVPIVRLVTLIPNTELMSAKYLYLYLKQLHISGTGTTQQQLTVPDFRKTEIIIPTKEIMERFNTLITPMFNSIWNNKEQNEKLANLRDTLLPKLMSGEIDVSNIEI